MKKLRNILTGWGRALGLLKTPPDIQAISQKRLAACNSCPASKMTKFLDIVNGNLEEVHAKYCTMCKCPCLEKSLVLEERCPLKRW